MAIRYIFFDCFNTLIDDVDETGDDSGIKPLTHIPVKHGHYQEASHFHQDYLHWRRTYWSDGNHDEVLLPDRIRKILEGQLKKSGKTLDTAPVVEEMLEAFYRVFPSTIRKSPEVSEVLDSLKGRVPMAVVSNFFLPDYPEEMLRRNDLSHYFDFVIDSAQLMIKKPGKEIYHQALQKAGIDTSNAGEVLFVGDNLKNDVLSPLEFGMQAWYFDRSEQNSIGAFSREIRSFRNWEEFSAMIQPLLI
jgi:HAD superfamily hydrolase (TIGR01549 family)